MSQERCLSLVQEGTHNRITWREPARRLRRAAVMTLLAAAAPPAAALDPDLAITQLSHATWQEELPQSTVHTLLQSRDGYLWLGTYEGLVRFDGARFSVFDQLRTHSLPGSTVHHLAEDREGRLWISSNGGLSCFG